MAKQMLFIPDKIKGFFPRINESVAEAKNSEHLLTLISQLAAEEFDADRASILLRDKQTG